jgi:TonB-dependent starch-binding outer membrane protein SusC
VVIITTKRGKEGRSSVSIDSYYGTQSVLRTIDVLGAREYALLANEASGNSGRPVIYTPDQINALVDGPSVQEQIFRSGPIQNHQIGLSGGNERTQYYVSGNFFDQQGIVPNSSFRRATMRLNFDHSISKALRVGTSVTFSKADAEQVFSEEARDNNGQTSVIYAALTWNPIAPLINPDGTFTRVNPNPPLVGNPLAILNGTTNQNTTLRLLANTYLDVRFLKNSCSEPPTASTSPRQRIRFI